DLAVRLRARTTEQIHGWMAAIARTICTCHQDGTSTVCYEAAVKNRERIADHAAREHILHTQWATGESARIELRPLPGRHSHARQLFSSRPVHVHVTGRCQRIGGDGLSWHVGRLVW